MSKLHKDKTEHSKEASEEIKTLRQKLKGFELLTDLFQKSKQECRHKEKKIQTLEKIVERLSGSTIPKDLIDSFLQDSVQDHNDDLPRNDEFGSNGEFLGRNARDVPKFTSSNNAISCSHMRSWDISDRQKLYPEQSSSRKDENGPKERKNSTSNECVQKWGGRSTQCKSELCGREGNVYTQPSGKDLGAQQFCGMEANMHKQCGNESSYTVVLDGSVKQNTKQDETGNTGNEQTCSKRITKMDETGNTGNEQTCSKSTRNDDTTDVSNERDDNEAKNQHVDASTTPEKDNTNEGSYFGNSRSKRSSVSSHGVGSNSFTIISGSEPNSPNATENIHQDNDESFSMVDDVNNDKYKQDQNHSHNVAILPSKQQITKQKDNQTKESKSKCQEMCSDKERRGVEVEVKQKMQENANTEEKRRDVFVENGDDPNRDNIQTVHKVDKATKTKVGQTLDDSVYAMPSPSDLGPMGNEVFSLCVESRATTTEGSLSDDISKNAARVQQLEKECQFMKIIISSLTEKNLIVKKENKRLKNQVLSSAHNLSKQMSSETEAETGDVSLLSEAPTSFGPHGQPQQHVLVRSMQKSWLEVEKQQTAVMKAKEEQIQELEEKVKKYDRRIQKLLDANSAWEKHSKSMEKQYMESLSEAQKKVDDLQKRLNEQDIKEERKVRNLETMLQEEKTLHQRSQSSLERRIRSFQDECEREGERANLAERKVCDLQHQVNELQGVISALNSDMRSMQFNSIQTQPKAYEDQSLRSLSRNDLITQISVLRQQVEVCTEDFTNEREDRARAQTEKDELNTELRHKKDELQHSQRELRGVTTQLESKTRKVEELERKMTEKIRELTRVKQNLRNVLQNAPFAPNYMIEEPPSYHERNPSAPTASAFNSRQNILSPTAPPTWTCEICTYDNPIGTVACRMCENPRNTEENIQGREECDREQTA